MRSYQKEIITPLIAAALLISIIIGSLFYALYQFNQIGKAISQVHTQRFNLTKLNHAIVYAEDNQRGYILTNSLTFLDHYYENKIMVMNVTKAIKNSADDFPIMVKHVLKSYEYTENLFKVIERNIQIQANAGAYAPHLAKMHDRGYFYMKNIQEELAEADAYLDTKLQEKLTAIDQIITVSIFLAVFLVISVFSILYSMYRRLGRFFNEILSNTTKVTQLSHQATHDPLTNLFNRRGFKDYLDMIHQTAYKAQLPYAVFYLDLDGFKSVNDQYSHEIGDKLLVEVSRTFQQFLRDNDCLARLGGDEFALIVQNIKNKAELETLANRLIQALANPIWVDGQALLIGVSIGVSIYRTDGFKPDFLLKAADSAMYQAKQTGKNRVCFYQNIAQHSSTQIVSSEIQPSII